MIYAYLRVSTIEQDLNNQKFGINKWLEFNELSADIWVEEKVSSRVKSRKIFKLVEDVKKGDVILVSEMSRLARSLSELVSIMKKLIDKKIRVVFVKESIDLHDANPAAKLQIHMLAAIAEFERDMISLRTKESLDAKSKEGMVLGRPKGVKSKSYRIDADMADIVRKIDNGISKTRICSIYHVSRPTLDSALKRWEEADKLKLDEHKETILTKLEMGVSKSNLATDYKVARSTLYDALKRWGIIS